MHQRYAICGLSARALNMFVRPLIERDPKAIAAIVDSDIERVEAFNMQTGQNIPHFLHTDFDVMVARTQPDVIIVATPDTTHADYITQALAHDLEVITEKPMTATAEQASAVLAAERRSRGSILVAHNNRYHPRHRQIKRMIRDGLIGRPVSLTLNFSVDTAHGSSYFMRWNRERDISGGLSVHKSCHHLDLAAWWLDDLPQEAYAYGGRNFYGPDSPHHPGRDLDAEAINARCPYARRREEFDSKRWELPYAAQYPADRSRTVYDSEIDVEDTYTTVLQFAGGATMSYTISFSAPWEGYRLLIDGTHGRIETGTTLIRDRPGHSELDTITYYPLFGPRQVHDVPVTGGGHGGADPVLRRDLFTDDVTEAKELGCRANSHQGAYAVAAGEAIWRSVRERRPIQISDLLDIPHEV